MIVEAGVKDCIIRVKISPHVADLGDLEGFTWLNLQHRSRKPLPIVGSIGRPLVGKTVHSCIGAVAGDITATSSAVGIQETILHRLTVCSRRIHVHRGFEDPITAFNDIHRLQIGLRVGIIRREDDVGGLSPNHPMRCGERQYGENCAREKLVHTTLDLALI